MDGELKSFGRGLQTGSWKATAGALDRSCPQSDVEAAKNLWPFMAPCRVTLGLPLIGASGGGGGTRARAGGLKRLMVMPGTAFDPEGSKLRRVDEKLFRWSMFGRQPEPPITVLDLLSVLFSRCCSLF
jgi:hypothetical protein